MKKRPEKPTSESGSAFKDLPPLRRRDMPQIRGSEIEKFLTTIRDEGISVEAGKIRVDALSPSQNELQASKVEDKLRGFASGKSAIKPFIVSLDGYIIDSHHQLAALKDLDPAKLVEIRMVHLSFKELLSRAKRFLS